MFTLNYINPHNYSCTVIGLSKRHNKIFLTRQAANEYMYKLCYKYGLTVKEVWDDNHDKTYHCTKGVTFYIQRA